MIVWLSILVGEFGGVLLSTAEVLYLFYGDAGRYLSEALNLSRTEQRLDCIRDCLPFAGSPNLRSQQEASAASKTVCVLALTRNIANTRSLYS